MRRGIRISANLCLPICAVLTLSPVTVRAKDTDKPDLNILVGAGVQTRPAHIGASESVFAFAPEVEVWKEGEPFPVEAPDESFGFAVIGERGKTSFGPAISFAPTRKRDEPAPGFAKIGFGVEAGGFAETYLGNSLRVRAELRQGIGGHKAMTGDGSIDYVFRTQNDAVVATIGPRVRWGSGKFNSAYFGVNPTESAASSLPAFQAKSGFYAYGINGGAHVRLSKRWGLFGFAGYDRITGSSARSPIVTLVGDKNQWTAGLVLTHRFKVTR